MCTYKGKQLGLGARRGGCGRQSQGPLRVCFWERRPWLPDWLQECLYTDCFRGRDGLPGAAGGEGKTG